MTRRIDLGFSLIALALAFGYAAPAHAYIDAGTGSMLLQVLVATVTGGLFLLKTNWRRIKARLTSQAVNQESAVPDTPRDGND